MCGIIGITKHKDAAKLAYLGLYALQHRGEEAVGVASYDGRDINIKKAKGLVTDSINERDVDALKGETAVGHTRYSTTGSSDLKNIQPLLVKHKKRSIAIAHNGNLTNTEELHQFLEEQGSIFQTSMDSEVIVHLLARTKNGDLKNWFLEVLKQLKGAFSLIFMVEDTIIGCRDPWGFRPLCLGKLEGKYVLASETCAFDLLNAEFIREIEPGEIVFVTGDKIESIFLPNAKTENKSQCIFENIYFARPDSNIFGDNVYQVRKRLGAKLAQEHPAKADFVMSIPDSGNYAATGYAQELGLPLEIGIIRNHYIGRTFIQPTQLVRDFRVRVKLNPIRSVLEGKKIIIVEDSIVRGTTSRSRIEVLRSAGVKEIHMRISCPPIIGPCFYGIDFPSKSELSRSTKQLKKLPSLLKLTHWNI